MLIVCCAPDTNVAGFDNNVLKLYLRSVGVGGYYVHRLITVCGLMGPTWFPMPTVAYLSSWAR